MSEDTRKSAMKIQERLGVLAAPRRVRSTFFFARLRSAGGVYLSGGLKPATETNRILTYPPLIEAGGFPTEIKSARSEHGPLRQPKRTLTALSCPSLSLNDC